MSAVDDYSQSESNKLLDTETDGSTVITLLPYLASLHSVVSFIPVTRSTDHRRSSFPNHCSQIVTWQR